MHVTPHPAPIRTFATDAGGGRAPAASGRAANDPAARGHAADASATTSPVPASGQAEGPQTPTTVREQVAAIAKPMWRGWIHTVSAPLAVVLGTLLLAFTDSARAVGAVVVFTACSIVLFGVSAVYHRGTWGPRAKALLRRFDHANIFLLIAGTYTPIAMLGLQKDHGAILLTIAWSVAVAGIVFKVFWMGAPRILSVALYLGMGWMAVMYLGELLDASVAMMVLVAVGGLVYTAGAVMYAAKRPNPWPQRFGFHEFFHAATLIAWLCHWVAILLIVLNPAVR